MYGNSASNQFDVAELSVPTEVKEWDNVAEGKNVDIVLQMDGYSWTINEKDITVSQLKDINLEVKENVNAIDPEGYVSFTMNHASDYVIVIDQKEMSQNDIPEALRFIGSSVQTGDTADVIPLSVIILLALVSVMIVIKMKRNQIR